MSGVLFSPSRVDKEFHDYSVTSGMCFKLFDVIPFFFLREEALFYHLPEANSFD